MKKVLLYLIAAAVLFSYGCSSRPALTADEEGPYNESDALVKQAGMDIEAAVKADGDIFAKELFSAANVDYENSKKFLEIKDFARAKETAIRASEEAKNILKMPLQAETDINETDKAINAAKDDKSDLQAPEAFNEAVTLINQAKVSYNSADYISADFNALKSAAAIKRAKDEPLAAKNAFDAFEADLLKAKELKIGIAAPEAFKSAEDTYELSKSNFAAKDNLKAKENAEKASAILKDEMKKRANLFVEQAKTDINSAKEAGAANFAAEQLVLADDALKDAISSFEKEDYIKAKEAADKVSLASKEAEARSKTGKEARTAAEAVVMAAASSMPAKETALASPESASVPQAVKKENSAMPAVTTVKTTPNKETSAIPPEKPAKVIAAPAIKAPVVKSIPKEETTNNSIPWIAAGAVIAAAGIIILVIRVVRRNATSGKQKA